MRYESRNKKLNRQPGTVKNWIYHRGDIYNGASKKAALPVKF